MGKMGEKPTLLVVDDSVENIEIATRLLSKYYRIKAATSGAKARQIISSGTALDLILLDLVMPEMSGLELCAELKKTGVTQEIPVIFLTGAGEVESLVQAFSSGAVDYVLKPFNSMELLARIRTHIELKQARHALVELNREKNEFLGMASHDLRNPLSVVRGFAQMIEENYSSDTRLDRFSKDIIKAADQMLRLLSDLLEVNRIERGELGITCDQHDLVGILSEIFPHHEQVAATKSQKLVQDITGTVLNAWVDRDVATRVFDNLISNAIKYSPLGKTIWLRLGASTNPGMTRFTVRDEGPGLSAEDQKNLFKKFSRLSNKPTGKETSTGLGLSIVKQLVKQMGGTVWCESVKGEGSTFFVELPTQPTETPAA